MRSKYRSNRLYIPQPLKSQIARSLEGQFSPVPLCQQPIFSPCHGELHPVTALHLERRVIAGGCSGMETMGSCGVPCIGMAVAADIGPFGDHGSCYQQPGAMIVLVPLAQSLYRRNHKYSYDEHKYQCKHDFKAASPEKGIHVHKSTPLFPVVYLHIIIYTAR